MLVVTGVSGMYSRVYRNFFASGGPAGGWGSCGMQQTPNH